MFFDVGPFVKVPLRRGFKEIQTFWPVLEGMEVTIAGGYARWCAAPDTYTKIEPADIDLFPHDQKNFDTLVDLIRKCGLVERRESPTAITFMQEKSGLFTSPYNLQVIKPLYPVDTPEQIISLFDLSVIRAAILSPTEVLVDPGFDADERNKVGRFKFIASPVGAMQRMLKYIKKGYVFPAEETLKIFRAWEGETEAEKKPFLEFKAGRDRVFGGTDPERDLYNLFTQATLAKRLELANVPAAKAST